MQLPCAIVERGPQQFYIGYAGEVDAEKGSYASHPHFLLRGEARNLIQLMDGVQGVLEAMVHDAEGNLTLEMVKEAMGKKYMINNGHQ